MKSINSTSIAILSSKGGTGKSQITVSLGYVLAHCGFKTLMIDLDLFTHGLSFYSLGKNVSKKGSFFTDFLSGECLPGDLNPVQIRHEFCRRNLFVLPNSLKEKFNAGVLTNTFDIQSFTSKLNELTGYFKGQFQYILVDTRGGSDYTTVAASQSTDGHIFITEADKPSIEMGKLLLKTIQNSHEHLQSTLGFVINKNVLPAEAIELFLSKEWELKPLASIGMDPAAIKYFQEEKVPVAESLATDFSYGILEIIRKTFNTERWSADSERTLKDLFEESSILKKTMIKKEQLMNQTISFAFIFRSYAILFLLYLVFQTGGIDNYLLLMSTVLVLFSFLTDPYFLKLNYKWKEKVMKVLKVKSSEVQKFEG